ncbi:MAG TPA: hypothetical protein VH083_13770 [Myxococcales bacterium]|nr:hypothetical protein [Myxococcales bacterium]
MKLKTKVRAGLLQQPIGIDPGDGTLPPPPPPPPVGGGRHRCC